MYVRFIYLVLLVTLLVSCSTHPTKIILDSSTAGKAAPDWAHTTDVSWAEGKSIFLKAQYSVLGSERLNGCYQLAELDAKQTLLTEVAEDLRGAIDNAQQSLSEQSEIILSQSRSLSFEGRLSGLKIRERYFERYEIKDEMRLDCFVLTEISQEDYNRIKRNLVNRLAEVDPELKKAITSKQVKFFSDDSNKTAANNRE